MSRYSLDNYVRNQVNGQLTLTHKYFTRPQLDAEVHIGNIPKDSKIEELFHQVQQCGDVYEVRLLMEFSGYNRGYGFVNFFKAIEARKAVCILNTIEFRPNWKLFVTVSLDNNKLQITGVPSAYSMLIVKDELSKELIFKNIIQTRGKSANKVNYILQFSTHREALEVRKQHWPKITLFRDQFDIDWAIPDSVMKATPLYFNNAPADATTYDLMMSLIPYIEITSFINIFKKNSYGNVLFKDRKSAENALHILSGKVILGAYMEWTLDKNSIPRQDEDNNITETKLNLLESESRFLSEEVTAYNDSGIDNEIPLDSSKIYYKITNGFLEKHEVLSQIRRHIKLTDFEIYHCKGSGYLKFRNEALAKEAYSILMYLHSHIDGKTLQFSNKHFGTCSNVAKPLISRVKESVTYSDAVNNKVQSVLAAPCSLTENSNAATCTVVGTESSLLGVNNHKEHISSQYSTSGATSIYNWMSGKSRAELDCPDSNLKPINSNVWSTPTTSVETLPENITNRTYLHSTSSNLPQSNISNATIELNDFEYSQRVLDNQRTSYNFHGQSHISQQSRQTNHSYMDLIQSVVENVQSTRGCGRASIRPQPSIISTLKCLTANILRSSLPSANQNYTLPIQRNTFDNEQVFQYEPGTEFSFSGQSNISDIPRQASSDLDFLHSIFMSLGVPGNTHRTTDIIQDEHWYLNNRSSTFNTFSNCSEPMRSNSRGFNMNQAAMDAYELEFTQQLSPYETLRWRQASQLETVHMLESDNVHPNIDSTTFIQSSDLELQLTMSQRLTHLSENRASISQNQQSLTGRAIKSNTTFVEPDVADHNLNLNMELVDLTTTYETKSQNATQTEKVQLWPTMWDFINSDWPRYPIFGRERHEGQHPTVAPDASLTKIFKDMQEESLWSELNEAITAEGAALFTEPECNIDTTSFSNNTNLGREIVDGDSALSYGNQEPMSTQHVLKKIECYLEEIAALGLQTDAIREEIIINRIMFIIETIKALIRDNLLVGHPGIYHSEQFERI